MSHPPTDLNGIDWYNATPEQEAALIASLKFTPDDIFPDVEKWSNTPTSDFLCTRVHLGVKEFLLTRRMEKPWAGQFFIPGGRIKPGFTSVEGCDQNCMRELGFSPVHMIRMGEHVCLNPESKTRQVPYFTLMHLFEVPVTASDEGLLRLDKTASEKKWFSKVEDDFPVPVQEILRDHFGFA